MNCATIWHPSDIWKAPETKTIGGGHSVPPLPCKVGINDLQGYFLVLFWCFEGTFVALGSFKGCKVAIFAFFDLLWTFLIPSKLGRPVCLPLIGECKRGRAKSRFLDRICYKTAPQLSFGQGDQNSI